ncbi:hypothetical protein NDU88_002061 [Pleurodeles waltl]|uniref:Uncharacterized protein n=1 Tax=Pleurodeles waltl TaxID=8319 RepID=A0AAV7Q5M6_PLEWA|nr:hypothetical protein NDU88_002061 [Pleurodeles waltl]
MTPPSVDVRNKYGRLIKPDRLDKARGSRILNRLQLSNKSAEAGNCWAMLLYVERRPRFGLLHNDTPCLAASALTSSLPDEQSILSVVLC